MNPRVCRVFLVGEGTSDIGDLAYPPDYREGNEGYMQPLLRNLSAGDFTLEFDGTKLMAIPKAPASPGHTGHARKAAQGKVLARTSGANALVYVRDVDRSSGRPASANERRARMAEVAREVRTGLASVPDQMPTLIATPCRMIETWAMGDRNAIAQLTGVDADQLDLPPGLPEEWWGDEKNPNSNHPKRVLERVARGVPFAEIAEASDIDELARSCPLSFRPFADAATAAVNRCLSDLPRLV